MYDSSANPRIRAVGIKHYFSLDRISSQRDYLAFLRTAMRQFFV